MREALPLRSMRMADATNRTAAHLARSGARLLCRFTFPNDASGYPITNEADAFACDERRLRFTRGEVTTMVAFVPALPPGAPDRFQMHANWVPWLAFPTDAPAAAAAGMAPAPTSDSPSTAALHSRPSQLPSTARVSTGIAAAAAVLVGIFLIRLFACQLLWLTRVLRRGHGRTRPCRAVCMCMWPCRAGDAAVLSDVPERERYLKTDASHTDELTRIVDRR